MLLVYLGCIPYAKGLVVELVPSHAQSAWGSIGRGRGGGGGGRVRVMGLAAYLSKNKIIKNEKKNSLNEGDSTII